MKKLLLFILALLPIVLFAQVGQTFHVNATTLNLRSEPDKSGEIVEKLNQYDNLLIINDSIKPGWVYVQFNESKGYVSSDYISKGKSIITYHEVRTGAVCKDGTSSTATGKGACSHHGGVAYWKTKKTKSVRIVE